MKRIILLLSIITGLILQECNAQEEKLVTGHSVDPLDRRVIDWIGKPPDTENLSVYSNGEYIWRDAKGDNTGAGKYTEPLNPTLQNAADLLEFRVTFDDKNVYFLIKCTTPVEWWAPYRIIGIDKDGAYGGLRGTVVLAQGNPYEVNSYNGTYAELRVSPPLACEYVIAVISTYNGRIWDDKGKLIAKRDGESSDTPGFHISDPMWSVVEVAVPIGIIGDPSGETWRFIVGTGVQDNNYAREIYKDADEWHGGGGEGKSGESGPDPDIYDIAGSDKNIQEEELSGYNPMGEPGDSNSYATIHNSYLTVWFAGRK